MNLKDVCFFNFSLTRNADRSQIYREWLLRPRAPVILRKIQSGNFYDREFRLITNIFPSKNKNITWRRIDLIYHPPRKKTTVIIINPKHFMSILHKEILIIPRQGYVKNLHLFFERTLQRNPSSRNIYKILTFLIDKSINLMLSRILSKDERRVLIFIQENTCNCHSYNIVHLLQNFSNRIKRAMLKRRAINFSI